MANVVAGELTPTPAPDPRVWGDDVIDFDDEAFLDDSTEEREDIATTLQNTIRAALERAEDHFEENIEPDLIKATEYYRGEPFGNEEEGRSKVVSTDVRDATLAQLPSLMRIFFSPERAVEFRPRGPEDVAQAAQETDYINYVITEDNNGFLVIYGWLKDALVRRLGIVKWWYDNDVRVESTVYSGVSQAAVLAILQEHGEDALEIISVDTDAESGEEFFEIKVTTEEEEGIPRFAVVPPEEFRFTPSARDLDTAPLVAHVRKVPVDTLRGLGISEDMITEALEDHGKFDDDDGLESTRRVEGTDSFHRDGEDLDETQREVLYAEVYALVDGDGDKRSELRLFKCIGPESKIANGDGLGEIADEVPFSVWTPDPEPHTLIGLGNWDLLKDVQLVKSEVKRGMLNSLSQAIEPQLAVDPGKVNMGDVVDPEISGIIRTTDVNAIREIKHTFVGAETLAVLQYYDEVRENRTGQTKAAQGLDADSLQSSTKAAVAATISASQARIELIARIFAETGLKRLYKGLRGLVIRNQNRKRMVKLRNTFVEVDPRTWKGAADVQVNVGLGQGTPEDRFMALTGVLASQEKAMGAGAPFVSWVEIRSTLAAAVELAGLKHADTFFKPWGQQEQEQFAQQQAQQPPQPDPNQALVEVEKARQQSEQQMAQAKLQLEQWKAQREDDRERDKLARDTQVKIFEIEAKYGAEQASAQLQLDIERDRAMLEQNTKITIAQIKEANKPAPNAGGD